MPGISRRAYALATTALAFGLLAALPARAQSTSSVTTIESQIKALQRELQEVKRQMQAREATLRAAREAAQQAKESAAQAKAAAAAPPPPGPAVSAPGGQPLLLSVAPNLLNTIPGTSSGPSGFGSHLGDPDLSKGAVRIGGVTIQLGGFIAAESAIRDRNQSGDLTTSFTGTPFNQSPLAHEASTTFTARQSRISLLAFGDPTPTTRISGYYEMDFFGGTSNGNNTESNSYSPRIRHLYASVDYDDRADDVGLHVLAGQTFSLVTPYYSGLLPRSDNTPRTIDPQYLVGFTWARQPQVRVAADFLDHRLWVGLSAEAAQTTYTTTGFTSTTGVSVAGTSINEVTLPTGGVANINNAGISPDYSGNNFSVNGVPDFVLKVAADPGFGHYEAYGLLRVLSDRVIPTAGHGSNNSSIGGGGGASAAIHVFSGLDLVGDVLAGNGIGRYGSGQLSDATLKPNGEVVPIPEIEALVGAIGHPVQSVDLYGYLGTEQEGKVSNTYAGKAYGIGTTTSVNSGCGVELSTAACTGTTKALYEATLGGWYRAYRGNYGTLQTGLQYSHIWRLAFTGVGGTPQANEDVVFLSFRYYPFQ
jgi:hypothetical protein